MIIPGSLPSDGNRKWKVSIPPTIEPITVDELKLFARIDGDDEDALLEAFIKAAREGSERYLGRSLIRQQITMKMDYWPDAPIELPRPPLISIVKVSTLDEDDVETEYDSNYYYVITEAAPGLLIVKNDYSIPVNSERYYGGFKIDYLAGYGLTNSVGSLVNCTSNGTATITKATHGLSLANDYIVDITDCTTLADKGLYRVVDYTASTIILDRVLSGSDADVDLTVYQATLIPESILNGIKLWAASIYENRTMAPLPPPEARLMLDLERVMKL